MKVLYTNSDQLVNKRDDLCMAIAGVEPDLIMVSEVIPKAQMHPIHSALLSVPGYCLITNFDPGTSNLCRSGKRGICVYLKDHIKVSQITFMDTVLVEQVWLQVQLTGSDRLIVGCIYRSPSVDLMRSTDELNALLSEVVSTEPSHLLIAGDFNYPQIDWDLVFCSAPESHPTHKFLNAVQDCLLFQHVTQPTRFREGTTPNVLDLVLTNEEGMLNNLQYLPGLGKSDHVMLQFTLACYTTPIELKERKLNYNRADFVKMNTLISDFDWSSLISDDIKSGYALFKEKLTNMIRTCVPEFSSSSNRKNIYMTSHALKLRKLKNALWKKCSSTGDPIDVARFRIHRNKLRKETRRFRKVFEARLVSDIRTNPKAFWRYSNSRLKTKAKIGDITDTSGVPQSSPADKARIFNAFFASVFTREEATALPVPRPPNVSATLDDVHISRETVARKLGDLKPSGAPGPDDLHPSILRGARQSIAIPMTHLFRSSLDSGILPAEWSVARVVPIFKKGDKRLPSNYRPVSLTAVPCKVLESLIRDQMMAHLSEHGLISSHQHGFRPGRSCVTQLLEVLDSWTRDLDDGKPVDAIYLDFQKAFDSVPHQRLLVKLESYLMLHW